MGEEVRQQRFQREHRQRRGQQPGPIVPALLRQLILGRHAPRADIGRVALHDADRVLAERLPQPVELDPPQVMWALPLTTRSWTYKAGDGSFSQAYEMWGPVPVKGPDGEVPGYVVAATQSTILGLTTLERRFIPGFGMVREVTIMAAGGNLISRQELVLDTERAGSD